MKNKIIGIFTALFFSGLCLTTSPVSALEASGVDIHGFISQGFIISDEYNYLTIKSDAYEKDLALSLRFDINDYTVFKLEGHLVDGTAMVILADNSDKRDDSFSYGLAKITFSF